MSEQKIKSCFVVGPIGREGDAVRKKSDFLLKGIVKPVLEHDPFNYKVTRADEMSKPGMISIQVIDAVINADLVVADLTGHNPNAFYELALRHVTKKPVIHMISVDTEIPFDVQDYRAIFFDTTDIDNFDVSRRELASQTTTTQSADYASTNPIITAINLHNLKLSGDEKDEIVASILENFSDMRSRISNMEQRFLQRPMTPISAFAPSVSVHQPFLARETVLAGGTVVGEPFLAGETVLGEGTFVEPVPAPDEGQDDE